MNALHVAVIMDGNGRWAQARGHARFFGHVRGAARVREVVEESCRLGVRALTLYAFSTENWKRPEHERAVLWKLLARYLTGEMKALRTNDVRLRVIGDRSKLPPPILEVIEAAESSLASCHGLQFNLAISYGARDEILRAARAFALRCQEGSLKVEASSEADFSALLDTGYLGVHSDVDLLIRTGGERRVSNFLLWQSAYAELDFVDQAWPDFTAHDFRNAVARFSSRRRRFGATEEQLSGPGPEWREGLK
ncbi:MAG: hypothetical protein RJB38_122 [Pseudomonadota bacterium]|jgi:undecaprenyl diphosphate synthase